ncbi:ferredoxin [Ectobacillus sp. sgz5001026]|uniref:(2Fe-2S) ferredoxin domain-containing protein n=1 Tax=Ectobacillus sp. sgz5001026 TaxID=3242473 RepID=UPI0036D3377D
MTTWNLTGTKHHVLVCNGSSCMRKGGEEVTQAIRGEITKIGADALIHTTRTRCNGRCKDAPIVIAYPQGTWYKEVDEIIGRQIVQQLASGNVLDEAVLYHYEEDGFIPLVGSKSEAGILKSNN